MQTPPKRVGLLTAGGDCPGLNAVIRALAKCMIFEHGITVIGIMDGFKGLVENTARELTMDDVSGILTLGGTILGTTNRENPFKYPVRQGQQIVFQDRSRDVLETVEKLRLDMLIAIGGDGTQAISHQLQQKGLRVIGVPKTIDNDLHGTDLTFGHDTAVTVAAEAIDRIHTTAMSHHRVMVVETMGRYSGWIALRAGIAAGGDILLIPEIPYHMEAICRKVHQRSEKGRRSSIVVVAEGAKPRGGGVTARRTVADASDPIRLGGVGERVALEIEKATCVEARATILGHIQRGGTPTPFDRILATRYGVVAAAIAARGESGMMVALHGDEIAAVPLESVACGPRLVPESSALIKAARSVGSSFGD